MDENTVQVRGASASLRKKNNKVDNVQKSGTKQHYMYFVLIFNILSKNVIRTRIIDDNENL